MHTKTIESFGARWALTSRGQRRHFEWKKTSVNPLHFKWCFLGEYARFLDIRLSALKCDNILLFLFVRIVYPIFVCRALAEDTPNLV